MKKLLSIIYRLLFRNPSALTGKLIFFVLSDSYVDKCILLTYTTKAVQKKNIFQYIEMYFIRCVLKEQKSRLENCSDDEQERYMMQLWSGTPGEARHAVISEIDQQSYINQKNIIVTEVRKNLCKNIQFECLCELGTGGGRFLEHISRELFGYIDHFVGIDLSEKIIAANCEQYRSANLNFKAADAISWVESTLYNRIIFISCSTFYCLTEKQMEGFLDAVTKKQAVIIGLSEVVNINLDRTFSSCLRPGIHPFYSHNYPYLFKKYGFIELFKKTTVIDASTNYQDIKMIVEYTI